MSPEQRQVSGIPNIGNTCYMNAVLQVLCWTPNFKEQLRKATEVIDLPNPQGLDKDSATDERSVTSPRIDKSLLKLVDSVRAGKTVRKSLPNAILDDVRQLNDRFEGHNQQDSYELFNTIIAGLEDLIEERCNCDNQTEQLMNKSPVSRLFSGAFFTAFTYESCNHIETKFQRFTSIPVQIIPKTNLLSNNSSVKESSVPSNSQEAEKGDTDRQYQDNHSDAYNNCSDTEYTSLSDHRSASKHATDLLHHQYVRCLRTLENNSWGHTDLEDGLKLFTEVQKSSGTDFCRTCAKTGNRDSNTVTRSRRMFISLPPILVLQFNRFKMNEYGQLRKIDERLTYPEYLDVAPFCSSAFEGLDDHQTTMYRLYGVVCHIGSIKGGHYTSRVRTPVHVQHEEDLKERFLTHDWQDPEKYIENILSFWQEKQSEKEYNGQHRGGKNETSLEKAQSDIWYTISDTNVRKCPHDGHTALEESDAYILMYERV